MLEQSRTNYYGLLQDEYTIDENLRIKAMYDRVFKASLLRTIYLEQPSIARKSRFGSRNN